MISELWRDFRLLDFVSIFSFQGVFFGLVAGLMVGAIRMGLEWSQVGPTCGSGDEDTRFIIVSKVHYLHFAIILAAVTSIVIVVVSLFTKPRTEAQVCFNYCNPHYNCKFYVSKQVLWWDKKINKLFSQSVVNRRNCLPQEVVDANSFINRFGLQVLEVRANSYWALTFEAFKTSMKVKLRTNNANIRLA